MSDESHEELARRFEDDELVDRAFKQAVRDTLSAHKRMGNSVVVWRDGRPVWLPPKEIPVDER